MGSRSATTSSEVIAARFAELRRARRCALVVYLTAGHPDRARSLDLLRGVAEAGADFVEIGVPFSDPLADGPIIQLSSQRALEGGMSFDGTLELIAQARVPCPVVLFTYLNPVLAAGSTVLTRAADAGAHGILITDLPVGADPAIEERIGDGPLAYVRLVAPTTPAARMSEIGRHGSGFVYLISRLGVTGLQDSLATELPATIERLRSATTLPICVGFGISRPEQAASVARMADGVVVGSALVRQAELGVTPAMALVRSLRRAIDQA